MVAVVVVVVVVVVAASVEAAVESGSLMDRRATQRPPKPIKY